MSETDDDRTGHEAGDRESDGGSILDGGIDTDARAGRSQGIDPTTERRFGRHRPFPSPASAQPTEIVEGKLRPRKRPKL